MIAQCLGCNRSDLPQKHECLKFRLCRACWKKQGSPFIEAGHTCGECEKPFWATRGILFRLGVCRPCFDRLRNQTLRDCYGGLELEWGLTWQHNAVFLGNLDYQLVAKDVHGFVHNLLFDGRALNHYLFSVKCRRGGHWAHHWAHAKVFKQFAFVTFTFARDAARLLQLGDDNNYSLNDRRVVIRPCLVRGSWLWLEKYQTWVRTDETARPPRLPRCRRDGIDDDRQILERSKQGVQQPNTTTTDT